MFMTINVIFPLVSPSGCGISKYCLMQENECKIMTLKYVHVCVTERVCDCVVHKGTLYALTYVASVGW